MWIFLPILRVFVGATNLVLVGEERAVLGCLAGTAGGIFLAGLFSSSFLVGWTCATFRSSDLEPGTCSRSDLVGVTAIVKSGFFFVGVGLGKTEGFCGVVCL